MMNERIKELLKQSGATSTEHSWIMFTPKEAEKFTELIVEECASIMRARLFPDYEGNSRKVAHNNALLCAISDLNELMESEE